MKWPALIAIALCIAVEAHAAQDLKTEVIAYREVDQLYSVDAVVEAVKQTTVSAQVSGRIVAINFDVGDRVKRGEVIVRIDEREVADAYAGSQAQIAQAQAALRNAQSIYERTRELFSQKFVSQAALDKALADYKAAQAQLEAAVALGSQAATVKSYATVVAPYSGVVAQRSIPQRELAAAKHSGAARVEFPALARTVTGGSITFLPAADAQTHTTRVRVNLPQSVVVAYPGMFARVHFSVGRAQKLVIPEAAVVRRSELTAVYVVSDGGAVKLRQIRPGEAVGEAGIEVLAGLSPGDRIALEPATAAPLAAGATK
ncbi:MAG: efflux RND transporter periplasmic adaptor subunit [Betaproteobacteria bacterium]|nr:efflux RND transporter periplasmic adaptor subunit [Betaproteobacteria bacterium]